MDNEIYDNSVSEEDVCMELSSFIKYAKGNQTFSFDRFQIIFYENTFNIIGPLEDYKVLKAIYKEIKMTRSEGIYLCPSGDSLLVKNKLDKIFKSIPKDDLCFAYISYINDEGEEKYSIYTYDELIEVINLIKYYRSFIDKDLTPLEKVCYAYDLVKSIKTPGVFNDLVYTGNIKHYIDTGNIACMGYSTLLKNLLDNIDDNINIKSFITKSNTKDLYHARNIIYIKDSVYELDGIFLLDATWDSNKFTKTSKGKKIEGLDLYNCFLFNNRDFMALSNKVQKPELFIYYDEYKKLKNKYTKRDLRLICEYVFGKKININKINELVMNENTFETMIYLLITIRHLEGYKKREIAKELNRFVNHNTLNTLECKEYIKDLVLTLKK